MATTTPNFGWPVPTSSDLVKNGATAIEGLGDAIDASLLDLKGGTTGQVLKKNTNTDMDFVWSADSAGMTNPMTTTGDTIYSSSGSTPARLGIGSTGQVLTVAGGVPTWAAAAGGSSGPAFSAYRTSNATISTNTWVKIPFNTEYFDLDSCYDAATNYRFTPTTAGIYQFNMTYSTNGNNNGSFYKNGSQYLTVSSGVSGSYYGGSVLISMNGSTDYVEAYVYSSGSTLYGTAVEGGFSGAYIRSN